MSIRVYKLTASVIFIGAAAFAQSNQGTITGTISDPAGAVIAGAQIEIRNADTGVVYQGGTSNTGNYVIPVPAGTYQITVSVPGFKKFVESNVPVVVNTDTRKDVTLQVGEANEQVTVADTAPLLKTESGEMSHVVEVNDADQLPVLTIAGGGYAGATQMGNIRNPLQTSLLLPGVQFANDMELVVNGLPSNSEVIRIEGQDVTGTLWKVYQQRSQTMSVDAVQEVNVQTSNFAAEYGGDGGGYFNFVMKSGTNSFHGSGYDYFVNTVLDAGLPFTNAGTENPAEAGQHIRNPVIRNDFGGTIGGPIRIPKIYNGKDRTFFFVNFEQYRENRTISNGLMTVPTQAYRDGNFQDSGCLNFNLGTNACNGPNTPLTLNGGPAVDSAGQALTYGEIFDPTTTRLVNGYEVRNPFPNQTIPMSRMDPVALAIQNMLPLPNAPGLVNNYNIPSYLLWTHTTDFSTKIDHSLSPTAKLSFFLNHYMWDQNQANGFAPSEYPFTEVMPLGYRNWTTRLNFDDTLKPTLLLHIGIGYLHQFEPDLPSVGTTTKFNESSIGLHGYFDPNLFPTIFGMGSTLSGGWANSTGYPATPSGASDLFGSVNGVGGTFETWLYEEKPTGNTNLTWVHGNHIFKFGGELIVEGYPSESNWRANGNFTFSNAETSDPWQNGQSLNYTNGSGFNYASFLLGIPDSFSLVPPTQTKLGNHQFAFYAEDSWKVTRKFTLDYGLRYDYQTYLTEQYGREQYASFSTPNPTVGGLLGAGIYPSTCNCQLSHNYPWAFGPRVGSAYQINPKTVLRAGAGVMYGSVMTPGGQSYGAAGYYTYNSLGYGITPMPNGLAGGNPYPNLIWPNYNVGNYPLLSNGQLPPDTPSYTFYDPNARPPRILQWSFGIQREVQKDIVVEATYVGNREVWGAATLEDQIASNSLNNAILAHYGLNILNPATQQLLTSTIGSPQAIAAGFGPAYPGMPSTETVAQQLRPVPQWAGSVSGNLGPPIGKTWYDALQTKITKRFSHGLSAQASYVWSKALVNGTGSEEGGISTLAGVPIYNDIYNYGINKQLNQLVPPDELLITGSYVVPKLVSPDSGGRKALSQVLRDWQLGWVLRYQNGALIQSPYSNNQLNVELGRNAQTFWNYVPGVNPLAVNPNCGCFNPQTTLALNPTAWTDAPGGTFGVSAPFYDNYRWQRQPAESMSFGRNFHFGKEGKYNFFVRAEFQNIFNRLFLSPPAAGVAYGASGATNPATPPSTVGGVYTGGYGYVATVGGAGAQPRSGQIVGRFTF
jgi:hypothetical protein